MIKLRTAYNEQDQLGAIVDYVEAHARNVLNTPATPMNEADVVLLRSMQNGIHDDLNQLKRLFALTMNTVASEAAFQLVSKLMLRSHSIGMAAVHSPEAEQWRGIVRAMEARRGRAEKPERAALWEAVRTEQGERPILKPNKEAASMLNGVNARLAAAGYSDVKVDAVRRILEKLRVL